MWPITGLTQLTINRSEIINTPMRMIGFSWVAKQVLEPKRSELVHSTRLTKSDAAVSLVRKTHTESAGITRKHIPLDLLLRTNEFVKIQQTLAMMVEHGIVSVGICTDGLEDGDVEERKG